MVAPSNSRSSAVALARLIAGVVTTPAAQIIGLVWHLFPLPETIWKKILIIRYRTRSEAIRHCRTIGSSLISWWELFLACPYRKMWKCNNKMQALLCSVIFAFGSALCDIILIFFFKQDCERAEYQSKEDEEESVDENSFLIGSPKMRSESLLEASVRSRAATSESYYWDNKVTNWYLLICCSLLSFFIIELGIQMNENHLCLKIF